MTLNPQSLDDFLAETDGSVVETRRRPLLRRARLRSPGEPDLEWLSQPAVTGARRAARPGRARTARRPPILMVHGAYADAWCWAHTFFPYFAERGHAVHAISLRGHGASGGGDRLDLFGLADYDRDLNRALARIGEPCIVFGSSMGGLLAQRLIADSAGRADPSGADAVPAPTALVLLNSVPPTGMLTAATSMLVGQPRLFAELLDVALSGKPTLKFLRLIANRPLAETAVSDLFTHVGRESARALWEMSWMPLRAAATLSAHQGPRPPMLAFHGAADRMVPVASVDAIRARWAADVHVAPKIGHVPMVERDWRQVAAVIDAWLAARPASPSRRRTVDTIGG